MTLRIAGFCVLVLMVNLAYAGLALVGNENGGTISLIDTARDEVVGEIKTGGKPRGTAILPSRRIAYVSDQPANALLVIDLDQRIHRQIYSCTHNTFLEETLNEYYVLTLRIWFLALDRVARLDEAVREHRELMEAIRDADGDRAEDAMRRHVLGFERAIRQVL